MIADPLRPLPFGAVGSVHLLGLKAATILPRKLMMVLRTVAVVAAQQADPKQTTESRVQWPQEPDSFRGLKFGTPESEAKRMFKGMGRCLAFQ